jgi:putative ABC transport system substrate-binding protein
MTPIALQLDLLLEFEPEAKTIGLIYNSGETNSVVQADAAKEYIENLGLLWQEVTVTSVNDVQQAVQSIVNRCDALYIPADNTVASSMPAVHGVTGPAKMKTVCGANAMVEEGGLGTVGLDYYALGQQTGLMAIEVLEGADISAMPIGYLDKSNDMIINGTVAEEIGYVVPDKYKDAVVYPE